MKKRSGKPKKKPRSRTARAKSIVKTAADPKAWAKLRARRKRLRAKKVADAQKRAVALLAGILAGS